MVLILGFETSWKRVSSCLDIIHNKVTNKITLILGIIFHVFIGLTIGIWTFAIVMSACLILYLHTYMKIFSKDKGEKGNGIISK